MPETLSVIEDFEILDDLISRLEKLIAEAEEAPIAISSSDPPKKAAYRVVGKAASILDRKAHMAIVVHLDDARLVLRTAKTQLVRLMTVEATVWVGKNGRGETSEILAGVVGNIKRIRGGYEIIVDISKRRRVTVTPRQKLRECLERNDVLGWNHWCQEITDHIDLSGVDLRNANLSGFDLCFANLAGADLTGADLSNAILSGTDLSHTVLEGVTVAGADFFRVRLNRKHAGLLTQTGMPEIESVVFIVS